MLDPWIIEEIRRREEEERAERDRAPHLEIPMQAPVRDNREQYNEGGKKPGEERGVTIVDFTI
jgi:hypothetical protein